MTKYIINSGGIKYHPEMKRRFHMEMVKELGNKPKFLLCNFAQGRELWESKFQRYVDGIAGDMPAGVTPSFELAMPSSFAEQCMRADILYFHGGDDHLAQYWMRKFDLPALFANKIVATNSASSNMLAAHYWTCDWRECGDGLSLLPIKFIPHYKSAFGDADPRGQIDWDRAYSELKKYGDTSLPIHALEEGQYIVIEN